MHYVYALAALSLAPQLLGSAALANPPCRACNQKARAPQKQIEYRDKLVPVPYAQPVVYVPSYTATINPANTYNTTVTVTTPPAQQSLQVTVPPPPAVIGAYTAPGVPTASLQATVQTSSAVAESDLAGALRDLAATNRVIQERLCTVEKALGIHAPPGALAARAAPVPTRPFAALVSRSCVQCHGTTAATDGAGVSLTGPLTDALKMKVVRVLTKKSMPPQPNKHGLPAVPETERQAAIDDLMKP